MRHASLRRCNFQKCGFSTIKLLVKYENMNRQKKYQGDGKAAMKNQNDGKLVEYHTEQATGKGYNDQTQQQPTLCTQFPAVDNRMDDAQQKEEYRCQLMDMNSGQRYHDGDKEAD